MSFVAVVIACCSLLMGINLIGNPSPAKVVLMCVSNSWMLVVNLFCRCCSSVDLCIFADAIIAPKPAVLIRWDQERGPPNRNKFDLLIDESKRIAPPDAPKPLFNDAMIMVLLFSVPIVLRTNPQPFVPCADRP